MIGRIRGALLAAAFALFGHSVAAPAAKADFIIDNTGSASFNLTPFGSPRTATYGQTFTVLGPVTFLDSYSMFLGPRHDGSGSLDLRGYVAEWTGTNIGNIVFASNIETMNAAGTLQEFAFSPDITLTSGNTYVAFLSISELLPQGESRFAMPVTSASAIGGSFVYLNNTDAAEWHTADWLVVTRWDAWFKASFKSPVIEVPEPASIALFGAGLLGLGLLSRRRRA